MKYYDRKRIENLLENSNLTTQLISLIKKFFDINIRSIGYTVDTYEDICIKLNTMHLEDSTKYYQVFKNDFNSVREGGPKRWLFNSEINKCVNDYFLKDASLKLFVNKFFVCESNFENGYRYDILSDTCYKLNKLFSNNKKIDFYFQYNCVKDIHDLALVIKNTENINECITFHQSMLPKIHTMVETFDTEKLLRDKITFVIINKEKLTGYDFRAHSCEYDRQDILYSEKI